MDMQPVTYHHYPLTIAQHAHAVNPHLNTLLNNHHAKPLVMIKVMVGGHNKSHDKSNDKKVMAKVMVKKP